MMTRTDAEEFVTRCVEGSGAASIEEYDLDGIIDDLNEVAENRYDFEPVDTETFWKIVEENEI